MQIGELCVLTPSLPPHTVRFQMSSDPSSTVATASTERPNVIRRLYDWTLGWSDRPGGTWALFGVSFAESSFFPIPPDLLLMALNIGRPKRSFWFAAVCTVGSALGAIAGYYVGLLLFDQVGRPVLEFYGATDAFEKVGTLYRENLVLALGSAAFTPIPFKVFTIAGGAFQVPLLPFAITALVGRAARFFLVSALVYVFGPTIKAFIDKYFNILSIVFLVVLVLGFVVVRTFLH